MCTLSRKGAPYSPELEQISLSTYAFLTLFSNRTGAKESGEFQFWPLPLLAETSLNYPTPLSNHLLDSKMRKTLRVMKIAKTADEKPERYETIPKKVEQSFLITLLFFIVFY